MSAAKLEEKRRWREANSEKVRESSRKWYMANPEKAREKNRRWREANPLKVAEHNANRVRIGATYVGRFTGTIEG